MAGLDPAIHVFCQASTAGKTWVAGSSPATGAFSDAAATPRPKLLFLVTEDWYFWSHRLPVARAARDAGFEIVVAARVRDHG